MFIFVFGGTRCLMEGVWRANLGQPEPRMIGLARCRSTPGRPRPGHGSGRVGTRATAAWPRAWRPQGTAGPRLPNRTPRGGAGWGHHGPCEAFPKRALRAKPIRALSANRPGSRISFSVRAGQRWAAPGRPGSGERRARAGQGGRTAPTACRRPAGTRFKSAVTRGHVPTTSGRGG